MRKLGERELSLLGNDVTEDLLLTYLGKEKGCGVLEELALVKDGKIEPNGWRIISAYPFFGNGRKERKRYPVMIFSFLLALSSSLPSPFFDSPFFRKDGFVSLFPTVERKTISRLAYLVGKAMYSRSLFSKDGLVDRSRAKAFMDLSVHERLSYLVASASAIESVDCVSRALSLAELINGLGKKDLAKVMDAIESYSSVSLDVSLLTEFGILYEDEDGLIYARTLDDSKEEEDSTCTLSSDYTITCGSKKDGDIYLIAEPLLSDANTTQWLITKESIRKGFDSSLTFADIITILNEYSSYGVSETIREQIKSWEREYNQVRVLRGTVVITEERFASVFTLPGVKEHIIETLGERAYLFDSLSSPDWRAALESYGVNMLGVTKGPEFSFESPSCRVYDTCCSLTPVRQIPLTREIEFDEKSFSELRNEARNEWERVLVSSHLVFSLSGMSAFPFVDGLEYNDKKAVIRDAVKNGQALCVENTDGSFLFLIPGKIDGDTLTSDLGIHKISKMWKVASAPKAVIEKARE